jgi:hypothetical protein
MSQRIDPILRLVFIALLASACGCVANQYDEFTGTVTAGQSVLVPGGTVPLGGDFGCLRPGSAKAIWGFPLAGSKAGSIVFVYDPAAAGKDQNRLSNQSVLDVYYTQPGFGLDALQAAWPTLVKFVVPL